MSPTSAAEVMRSDRTTIMAILNVTPDSFSDGGQFNSHDAAVARGIALVEQGADLVDVGGESTRPGAERVDVQVELNRVVTVVRCLAEQGIAVSVDTTRARVAQAAVAAGAVMVNDVSGGLADPEMLSTVAGLRVPIVVMHWRAPSDQMDALTDYEDVVLEVRDHLAARLAACLEAGISQDSVILDPGLGFSKRPEYNWLLLGNLDRLIELGQPVLIGASRKRFLGQVVSTSTTDPVHTDQHFEERDRATATISALAAAAGVWGVRVHDVPGTRDAVSVANAWQGGRSR